MSYKCKRQLTINELFEEDPIYLWNTPCKIESEFVYIYSIVRRDAKFLITYSNEKISTKYFKGNDKIICGSEENKINIKELSDEPLSWQTYGVSAECIIDNKVVYIFKVAQINETNYEVIYSEGNLKEIDKNGDDKVELIISRSRLENRIENNCTISGGKSRSRKSRSRKSRSRKSRPRKSRPRKQR